MVFISQSALQTQLELGGMVPESIQEFIRSCISATSVERADSFVMRWGKYKGQSIYQIGLHDLGYLEWMVRNDFVIEKCPDVLAEAQTVLKMLKE